MESSPLRLTADHPGTPRFKGARQLRGGFYECNRTADWVRPLQFGNHPTAGLHQSRDGVSGGFCITRACLHLPERHDSLPRGDVLDDSCDDLIENRGHV